MYYSILYQGIFSLAFLNFLIFWTDLFFSSSRKISLYSSEPSTYQGSEKKKVSSSSRVKPEGEPQKNKIEGGSFEILEFFTSTILWFLLTLLLIFRYLKSNHFPLANFYEALIFLTWCLVTLNLFLLFFPSDTYKHSLIYSFQGGTLSANNRAEPEREPIRRSFEHKNQQFNDFWLKKPFYVFFKLSRPVWWECLNLLSKPQKKIYGGILAPCILFIIAFAQFNLSSEWTPLVPALKSNWLLMHVSIMIFSYTIFIVGGLISLILLVRALPFLRVPAFFNEKSDEKKNSQKKEAYLGKKLLISNFNEISEISSKTNLEIFPNFWEKAMSPFLLFGNKEIQLAYLGLIKKRNQFPFYSNLSNYSSNVSFPTGNNISQEKESGNFLNLNSFSYTFPSYIVDSVPFFPNFKESFLPPEFSKLSSKVMASNYSGDKQSLKRQKNKSEMIKWKFIKTESQMNQNSFSITLDQISYWLFGIGFPLFTLGILSGAVWANSAWGSYWSWDIKECGSLVQWLTIAFYLHCWYKNMTKLSYLVGFLSLVFLFFNFFGISLGIFGSSLHAYGASS